MQTAALILGILALAFLFVPGANIVLSPMMGIAALVLGLISRRDALARKEDAIMGKAGFITGLVALVISLLLIFTLVALIKHVGCGDCSSGCDWGRDAKQAEVKLEHLSDELKKELREEVRREVALEMKRARENRIRNWKNREPWTDEEWRETFEERVDEWIEWFDVMPIRKDVAGGSEPAPVDKGEPAGDEPEQPPAGKKPAKKPALLPDLEYPGGALE
ncbi:MAG: DUF308 domain-containing protein [Deltaproteobacteria bacterium]|nr:DUF308 domain-containing protein [Deltaproteobacteria bacterium]